MKASGKSTGESKLKQTVHLLIQNYINHNVGRNAAALAYYLLFALFPLLIFLSNLLGMLNLDVALITQELQRVLPRDIVDMLAAYLDYVSHTSGPVLLGFSLVFTIYFPMRASRGLMDDVRRAYQLPKSSRPVSYILRQLGYTVVLLLVIVLTLFLSTLGQRILGFIIEWIPAADGLNISDFLLKLWHYLRFAVAAVIMFAALGALYALAQDHRQPVRSILPGVIAALVAWLVLSIGFSFYVDHFANYSIIYGTLGAVIALLIWLYMTAIILIMGAELNAVLRTKQTHQASDTLPSSL